jgi:hypothetical protein
MGIPFKRAREGGQLPLGVRGGKIGSSYHLGATAGALQGPGNFPMPIRLEGRWGLQAGGGDPFYDARVLPVLNTSEFNLDLYIYIYIYIYVRAPPVLILHQPNERAPTPPA